MPPRPDIDDHGAEIVRRYTEERHSVRQLACDYACSYGKIHQILRSRGV